jgi:anti-sigma regulatory factor (Ser/Thr protein kinase)
MTESSGIEDVGWLALDAPTSAGAARRGAERLADKLGLPASRVAEIGLAATEIATNVQRHGGGGALLLRAHRGDAGAAVEIVALDTGPGIADLREARRDGSSSRGTLGIGLGAIERLADTLEIVSEPGRGTVLIARFSARSSREAADDLDAPAAGITRALSGEDVCGDAYAVRAHGRLTLMMCDGSGHGPLAASASRTAVRVFEDPEQPASPPAAVLARIHRALIGSRGGAVAVAELDPVAEVVRYAGVGNISGAILTSEDKRSMVSIGGVAGYREPTIRTFEYPLPVGAVVVMHSDGVRSRWPADTVRGLLGRNPLLMAAVLLRDAGARHDDACVLVGRTAR